MWTSAALVAALALVGSNAEASGIQKIARDGTVHRVTAGVGAGMVIGSSNPILHIEQLASGESVTRTLAGTGDGWNYQPALVIDPVLDEPIVVWTRIEGGDADVFLSRYDGELWSAPVAVVADAANYDDRPSVVAMQRVLHVFWEREWADGQTSLYHVSMLRNSFVVITGPKLIATDHVDLIGTDGGTSETATAVPPDLQLFVAEADGLDSSRILVVFGIRDEPMPIGFELGFSLPADTGVVTDALAERVDDRVVVSFVSGDLFYTVLDDGVWTELRTVSLESVSAAEARQQIIEMLNEAEPGSLQ